MGIIQKAVGGVKRMFGLKELAANFTFVKNFSKDILTSELHTKSSGRKPIEGDPEKLLATYAIFKKLCITYLIIAVFSVIYSAYHFAHHYTVPGLLSLGFCLLCLSFAFRYNFWMYQIKRRELGCTFKEWLDSTTGKGA